MCLMERALLVAAELNGVVRPSPSPVIIVRVLVVVMVNSEA